MAENKKAAEKTATAPEQAAQPAEPPAPTAQTAETTAGGGPKKPASGGGKKTGYLTYKGKPLVRSGGVLYYGDMADKAVVMMQILTTKTVKDMTIADKVQVQLMLTDPEMRMKDRILKKSEKNGLYNAMDIGAIWLERELEK